VAQNPAMFRLVVRDGSNVAMKRSIAFLLQHQPVDSPKALALGKFSPSIPRRARKLSKNFRSGTGSWNPANYIVLRYPPGPSWRTIEPFLRENQPNQQKPSSPAKARRNGRQRDPAPNLASFPMFHTTEQHARHTPRYRVCSRLCC
jgi:hypothetical protein